MRPPGERPTIMKDYYAAYVVDPVGNVIEVVYFGSLALRVVVGSRRWAPTVLAAAAAFVVGVYVSRKW